MFHAHCSYRYHKCLLFHLFDLSMMAWRRLASTMKEDLCYEASFYAQSTASWRMYSHCDNSLWSSHSLNSTCGWYASPHSEAESSGRVSINSMTNVSSPGRQAGFQLMSQILSLSKLDLSMGETWHWLSLKLRRTVRAYEVGLGSGSAMPVQHFAQETCTWFDGVSCDS